MAPKAATPAPRRPNPLKDRPPIKAPPPIHRNRPPVQKSRQKVCPNKQCNSTAIEDGACTECGYMLDEMQIVSEVQFGETSSGAAMVQGTYLSADQGGAVSMGIGGRGDGGGSRGKTLNDGRILIGQLAHALNVSPSVESVGQNIFKLAANLNFVQGRRMDMVAVVCLYSACRQSRPCRVMLIDFADKINVNVFKLGATFKGLQTAVPTATDGIMPIIPEDLIHRFASKLEFGDQCDKVAEDAVRMVKRMSLDWMVMGRRPSGVCGACLILAARMNNFRRTITEVVYIVKVTTHTIQKRLEEFKLTPSAALTVEEFLHNEFLESAHDPPSFYEKTEEFQKNKKKRKRKTAPTEGEENAEGDEGDETSPDKRQKTATPGPDQHVELRRDAEGFAIPPIPNPASRAATPIDPEGNIDPSLRSPDTPAQTPTENISQSTDSATTSIPAVGQLITPPSTQPEATPQVTPSEPPSNPATSDQSSTLPSDESVGQILEDFISGQEPEGEQIEKLMTMFSDKDLTAPPEENDEAEEDEVDPRRGKKGPDNRPIRVDEGWDNAEQALEAEISEIINDPNTNDHAERYAIAKQRAAAHMILAARNNPQKEVSMDVHIGEDEFKDDPEVMNCLLSKEDSMMKEKLWVNENKLWLRKQQVKEFEKRKAENGPQKVKRNRVKKARMGENQTEPAASPGEAAMGAVKRHAYSKKINYEIVGNMFDVMSVGFGSAATSRVTSHAGSEAGSRASSLAPSSRAGSMVPEISPLDILTRPAGKKNRERTPRTTTSSRDAPRPSPTPRLLAPRPSQEPESIRSTPAPSAPSDDGMDMDSFDYVAPSPPRATPVRPQEAVEDWRAALKQAKAKAPGEEAEEEEYEDENDYGMGDIEDGDLGDFGENERDEGGFGDEDEEEYGDDDME